MEHINYDPVKETDEFREKVRNILRSRYSYADIVAVEKIVLECLISRKKYGETIIDYLRKNISIPKESDE